MLSKFSGSHQNLRYFFLLAFLLGTLGISLFLAVSMGSVQISLSDRFQLKTLNQMPIVSLFQYPIQYRTRP